VFFLALGVRVWEEYSHEPDAVEFQDVSGVAAQIPVPVDALPLQVVRVLDQVPVVPGQRLVLNTSGYREYEVEFFVGALRDTFGADGFRITWNETDVVLDVPYQPSLESRHVYLAHVWKDQGEPFLELGLLRVME
jgi:hypothetical protein